jgi:hypothetical protein
MVVVVEVVVGGREVVGGRDEVVSPGRVDDG